MENRRFNALSGMPSVTKVLTTDACQHLCDKYGEELIKIIIRDQLDTIRADVINGKLADIPSMSDLMRLLTNDVVRYTEPRGRQAINATGILLHTGLGRAPLADNVLNQFSVFNGYSILQTDLATGARSLREHKIEKLLKHLTGCEAATVVNNNAAATMLILNSLAEGREVVISRGQLIEIGGSFRMPDVMAKSGVTLREIGTTNRTHLKDYRNAVTEETGAIIHVHTSNFRVRGFSGTPDISQLCDLRNSLEQPVCLIDDLGSGALVPLEEFDIKNEPLVKDSIAAGTDVVCFSGDKLICGPQAGIICGKKEIINKIRKNPFARMFRVDKMTLAALEETLLYFVNNTYREKLPFYQMLNADMETMDMMARQLVHALAGLEHFEVEETQDFSYIGSGSAPDEGLPTVVVKAKPLQESPNKIAAKLRMHAPSVFCRIKEGTLIFDMRTLLNDEFDFLLANLPEMIWESC